MREMKKQQQKRPYIIAGRLLAAGAAGWLLFRFHAPLIAAAASAKAQAVRFMDEQLASAVPRPATPAPAADAPSAQAPQTAPAPVPMPVAAPSAPAPVAAAAASPEKAAPAAPVADLPIPSINSAYEWVLYGRVYDLITLRPVTDARLTIGGSSYGSMGGFAVSDSEGRFMARLARSQQVSYEIHAARDGYVSPALYESDIPYASLSLKDRRAIVTSAQDGDITLPPLTDVTGEDSMRRDVFLAPSR
jgi:hypothetical protein